MDYTSIEPYVLIMIVPALQGIGWVIRKQTEKRVELAVDVALGESKFSGNTGRMELYSYEVRVWNYSKTTAEDVLVVIYSAEANERCFTIREIVHDSPFVVYLPSDFGTPNLVILRWKGFFRECRRRIPVHIPRSSMIDMVPFPK